MTDFQCSESFQLPTADLVWGALLIVGGPVSVPSIASGVIGYRRVRACRDAKRAARADFQAFMLHPPEERADASIVSVIVSGAEEAIPLGNPVPFRAAALTQTGAEVAGRVFKWSSSDSSIAIVDSQGRVTGRAAGTTMISAMTGGIRGSRTLVVAP